MTARILRAPAWLWLGWALALLLTLGLAFDISPWLRGDLDWRWPYVPAYLPGQLIRAAAVLSLYIIAALLCWRWALAGPTRLRSKNPRVYALLGFAIVGGLTLQIVVQTISDPDPWRELLLRSSSPFLQGYWEAALKVGNIGEYLRHFPEIAPAYEGPHVQRHPPGFVVYFALLQRAALALPTVVDRLAPHLRVYQCEYWPHVYVTSARYAAVVGGLLAPLLNTAAVVPLYAVGRATLDERAALGAVLLHPLLPGYLLWAGHWDQAFPFVTLLLLWLLQQAIYRKRRWAWGAAGGLLAVALFFSHAMLVLIALGAVYALIAVLAQRESLPEKRLSLLKGAVSFTLGLSIPWLIYQGVTGVSYLDLYRANTDSHYALATNVLSRMLFNPYDFVLFMGYILGLMGIVAVWRSAQTLGRRRTLSRAPVLVLSSFAVLAALIISGVARAEVGRVWVFLMPLGVLAAFTLRDGPGHSSWRWGVTASILAIQAVAMQAALFGERDVKHVYAPPTRGEVVNAIVGDAMELVAFDLNTTSVHPGETLELTLYWKALAPPPGFYVTFVHLYQSALGMAAQQDGPPQAGRYPTTCWQPGEIVQDDIRLEIPALVTAGTYDLFVGMYAPADPFTRLPTSGPQSRAEEGTIVLDQILIAP